MGMLYTYLWTFFLFAFLGWCSEVVFAAIRQRRFVNRGFLNGPLCPIYGIGVVAIDFLLRPFQGNLPVLLVGGMLLGSALEYLAGFFLEKLFHQKWWDYSDQPHNLHGYICLKFSILLLRRRLLKAFPNLEMLEYNAQLEELRQNVDVLRRRSWEALRKRNEDARAAYEARLAPGEERPFAFGLCFDKLFWIFMTGNVVGFLLETVFALVTTHEFQVRVGLVFGPFIPVYGLGAVVITLLLYRMYNQKDIMIFLASMFIGGGFEYLCSFVQQAVFGTVSWEYSDSPLNIGGRTNLMFSFFWGILGLVWVKDLYPAMSRTIQKIPKRVGRPLTIVVTVLMVIDILLSCGAVYRQSERVNNIPATNAVQEFFDAYFPDSYLEFIYPHMQYVGKPELPAPPPVKP